MSPYWKCDQCHKLNYGDRGLASQSPSQCEYCGNDEFTVISPKGTGSIFSKIEFNLSGFIKLCIGLIILNITVGVITAVAGQLMNLLSGLISAGILGLLAFGIHKRSRIAWFIGLVLFGLPFIGTVGLLLTLAWGMVATESLPGPVIGVVVLLLLYTALFGSGTVMLIRGRHEVW